MYQTLARTLMGLAGSACFGVLFGLESSRNVSPLSMGGSGFRRRPGDVVRGTILTRNDAGCDPPTWGPSACGA